jgi:hypothetical protein
LTAHIDKLFTAHNVCAVRTTNDPNLLRPLGVNGVVNDVFVNHGFGALSRLSHRNRRRSAPLSCIPVRAGDNLICAVRIFNSYFFIFNNDEGSGRASRWRLRDGGDAERRGWDAGLGFIRRYRNRRLDFSRTSASDSANSRAAGTDGSAANRTSSQSVEILRLRLFVGQRFKRTGPFKCSLCDLRYTFFRADASAGFGDAA